MKITAYTKANLASFQSTSTKTPTAAINRSILMLTADKELEMEAL